MQVQTKGEFGGLGIEVTRGGRRDQGRHADRRHARLQGRHPVRRHHHRHRRRHRPGPDARPGRRQDARPGQFAGHAEDPAQGPARTRIDFKLVRDVIKIQSVRSHVEGGDIGYIRITQFNEQTSDGLKRRDGEVPDGHARRQAQGLHPRSAQQSGRPARPVDRGRQRLHRPRRDRLDARPQSPTRRSATTPGPAATCRRASRSSC